MSEAFRGIRLTAAVVAVAMLVATAFGQPEAPVRALELSAGSLPAYLVRPLPEPPVSGGGTVMRAGTGLCFEPAAGHGVASFHCFHQLLVESSLDATFDGKHAYTVFAPTDAAFAHLASTLGTAAFRRTMASPRAARALVRQVVMPGSHTPGSLSFDGRRRSLVSLSGSSLTLTFGPVTGGRPETRTLAVGPAGALDGQAYMSGPAVRFPDGSVLVPIDRVPLTTWSPAAGH